MAIPLLMTINSPFWNKLLTRNLTLERATPFPAYGCFGQVESSEDNTHRDESCFRRVNQRTDDRTLDD